jgi:intracellular multiplication protein IcmG
LEASQQNLSADVSAINSKLNGINTTVNQLNDKIANLNNVLTMLTAKLEQQSSEIAILTERTKPKPVRRVVVRRAAGPMFYVQAIIPGRAWLIATNGSTITVREGTAIPGYGVVKLIDPNQGRVVTSSGQVIRFSQQDS